MQRVDRQSGFTLFELVIGVAIFGVIMLAVQRSLQDAADRVVVARTVAGFNTIAEAVYTRAVTPPDSPPLDWHPPNPAALEAFLPRELGNYAENRMPTWFVNGAGELYEVEGSNPPPETTAAGGEAVQNLALPGGRDCGSNTYCVRTWLPREDLADRVAGQIGPAGFPPMDLLTPLNAEVAGVGWAVVMGIGRPGGDAVNAKFVRNDCGGTGDVGPACNPTLTGLTFDPNVVVNWTFGPGSGINLGGGTLNLGGGTLQQVDAATIESLTVTGNLEFRVGGGTP